MEAICLNECNADGCYKKPIKGGLMCNYHQEMYDKGIAFKAFYGKTTLKKEFQEKSIHHKKLIP